MNIHLLKPKKERELGGEEMVVDLRGVGVGVNMVKTLPMKF